MSRVLSIVPPVLSLLGCAQPPAVEGAPPPWELTDIVVLTEDGGRVDWSPDGEWIAFDRLGEDDHWDLWQMRADGTHAECLTCDLPGLEGDVGQPAYHPSGDWLVFQAESPDHTNAHLPTTPGAGVMNDLVVMRLSDRQVFVLNDVRDGSDDTGNGGTLHPVFDHAGGRLLWTDYEGGCWTCPIGDWQIALADFVVDDADVPRLENRTDLQPGASGLWYETHGFGPDDDWIYVAANTEGQSFLSSDIVRIDLDTPEAYTRLTQTSGVNGEFWAYDEHAKLDPDAEAMLWLSDESGISEYWMMNPDGSGRLQVTDFNTEGHPHAGLVEGLRSVPSDNAWNPAAPPGTAEALGFVQVDFDLLSNSAPRNLIVKLTFARTE